MLLYNMTTPTNIPTENYTEITNKKFLWLNDMFIKYGWHIVKNDLNNIRKKMINYINF